MAESKSPPLSKEAIFYMILLAFQFGLQPILTRRFTPPTICKSTVIISQEFLKFGLAFLMLQLSGGRAAALRGT
jgi:UDP-sugar transporter A1/2/3